MENRGLTGIKTKTAKRMQKQSIFEATSTKDKNKMQLAARLRERAALIRNNGNHRFPMKIYIELLIGRQTIHRASSMF